MGFLQGVGEGKKRKGERKKGKRETSSMRGHRIKVRVEIRAASIARDYQVLGLG